MSHDESLKESRMESVEEQKEDAISIFFWTNMK